MEENELELKELIPRELIEVEKPANLEEALLKVAPSVVTYIETLEQKLMEKCYEAEAASERAKKAFEAKRALDQQHDLHKTHAEQKLMFVQASVNNLVQAMRLIGGH